MISAGLWVYTELKVEQIKEKNPPIGQFVSIDGLQIHYVRQGTGQPVVMLHGRDGALQEYTFSIFEQVAEDYDVIAFDRPGYGYSEWPENDSLCLETQAGLINKALRELDIENPILVGHSCGGAVVLRYLIDYPDQACGAVLLGPVTYMQEPPDGSLFAFPNIPILGPILTNTILLPIGGSIAERMYQHVVIETIKKVDQECSQ
jgi:pimeloyl-ACP methyl ester carboxylesterase